VAANTDSYTGQFLAELLKRRGQTGPAKKKVLPKKKRTRVAAAAKTEGKSKKTAKLKRA